MGKRTKKQDAESPLNQIAEIQTVEDAILAYELFSPPSDTLIELLQEKKISFEDPYDDFASKLPLSPEQYVGLFDDTTPITEDLAKALSHEVGPAEHEFWLNRYNNYTQNKEAIRDKFVELLTKPYTFTNAYGRKTTCMIPEDHLPLSKTDVIEYGDLYYDDKLKIWSPVWHSIGYTPATMMGPEAYVRHTSRVKSVDRKTLIKKMTRFLTSKHDRLQHIPPRVRRIVKTKYPYVFSVWSDGHEYMTDMSSVIYDYGTTCDPIRSQDGFSKVSIHYDTLAWKNCPIKMPDLPGITWLAWSDFFLEVSPYTLENISIKKP